MSHKNNVKEKSQKSKAPTLTMYLELNAHFGYGYQTRMVMDNVMDSVFDESALTLPEAYSSAVYAIEEINKRHGYQYDPHKAIHITEEAIRANKSRDITAARIARDIQSGKGELIVPCGTGYITETINGQEETLLTGRGVVLTIFFSWRYDKTPKAKLALERYCSYLAMLGYDGGATGIWKELEAMGNERGANWIKATHGRFVKDDQMLIQYLLA